MGSNGNVLQYVSLKLNSVTASFKYRRIPKISPRGYIFQMPFLRGLFLEGLIFGGAYLRRSEIGVSKSIGLANLVPRALFPGSGPHHQSQGEAPWERGCGVALQLEVNLPFLLLLLCTWGQFSKYKPPWGLNLEGRFNGEFFCVTGLGLYLEGLIHGGAYFLNFTVFNIAALQNSVKRKTFFYLEKIFMVSTFWFHKVNIIDMSIQWCECYARCDWSLPMVYQSLYNDVYATGAVIGRCSWSIGVQIHGDVTGNLFSLFCSTWGAVLKMFVRLFRIKVSESL